MTAWDAFFKVHSGLPREGPGRRSDLDWALGIAPPPKNARILDAGCGPGADIKGLLEHVPQGSVTAVDTHGPFVEAVAQRFKDDARVTATEGDMADIPGSFDLIWSAGALYFLGIEAGLKCLRGKLAPGGTIMFSHLVYCVPDPCDRLRADIETLAPDTPTYPEHQRTIRNAGFRCLGQRSLSRASWQAYYDPIKTRIAELRPGADDVLSGILDEEEAEIAIWRKHFPKFSYVLSVVEPR